MNTTTSINSNSQRVMIILHDENILKQIQTLFHPSSFETVILDAEANENKHSDTSSADEIQSETRPLICVICGATALGRNFGVVACESCKLFFRRNGLKDPTKLFCLQNNNCNVHFQTRRRCLPCRLRKCLNCGMKRDRLLKAEEKAAKRLKSAEEQSQRILPLDLDQNITFEDMDFLQLPMYQNLLTTEDLERLETLRTSFENRVELASQDGLNNSPRTLAQNLLEHINTHSVTAIRLLAFFKQIPEFNQLNVNDKMILIKYNLMLIIVFIYMTSMKRLTDNIFEVDTDIPWNESLVGTVHSNEISVKVLELFQPIVQIATYDNKIIPLALAIFILLKGISTGEGVPEPILEDGMTVYRAHNFYTELLWKYLETTYGSDEAVRIMSNLVTRFLSWQILYIQMRYNIRRNLSENDVNELLPLMKSLLHV